MPQRAQVQCCTIDKVLDEESALPDFIPASATVLLCNLRQVTAFLCALVSLPNPTLSKRSSHPICLCSTCHSRASQCCHSSSRANCFLEGERGRFNSNSSWSTQQQNGPFSRQQLSLQEAHGPHNELCSSARGTVGIWETHVFGVLPRDQGLAQGDQNLLVPSARVISSPLVPLPNKLG